MGSVSAELRQAVLQAAMQGKLTEQLPEDGNARDLLKQIKSEKERLVQEKKIKKEKELAPITEDEIPFDIPDNWEWCKTKDISQICTGKRDANFGSVDGVYPFFTCASKPINCRSYSFDCDAILLAGNGDFNNINMYSGKFEAYQRTYVVTPFNNILLKYLYFCFKARWVQSNFKKSYGSVISYVRLSNVENFLFPLPPLAEQKRIVARVDELMAKIDELEVIENNLRELHQAFPNDMKAALLQSAIQGNLTNNFDYEECDYNDLFEISGGSQPSKSYFISEPKEGYVQLYQTRDYGKHPQPVYIPISMAKKQTQEGDILLARYGGSLGKVFWAKNGAYNVAMAKVIFKNPKLHNPRFVFYYHLSSVYQNFCLSIANGRSAQAGFNKDDIGSLPYNLFSLEEQQRIVEKLDRLLPLCDSLQTEL